MSSTYLVKKTNYYLICVGNARSHEAALNKMLDMGCSGETSLQNAITMAHHILRSEILFLANFLLTDFLFNFLPAKKKSRLTLNL